MLSFGVGRQQYQWEMKVYQRRQPKKIKKLKKKELEVKGRRDSVGQWVGFLRWRESEILLLVFGLEYLNVSGPAFCFIWNT